MIEKDLDGQQRLNANISLEQSWRPRYYTGAQKPGTGSSKDSRQECLSVSGT